MHYLPTIHSGCQIVVLALEHRIRLVKEKASYSEKAVLEITKDMKRLDCAKKTNELLQTRSLHMLVTLSNNFG
jgi:RNase P subunit RPR2